MENKIKHSAIRLSLPPMLGFGLASTLVWLVSASADAGPVAHAAELHVCPSGCAYTSIQPVDVANDGDVIQVATGTYTGVSARGRDADGLSQHEPRASGRLHHGLDHAQPQSQPHYPGGETPTRAVFRPVAW